MDGAMNAQRSIEYDKFMAFSGVDLCRYMEPLLADRTTSVSDEVLHRMLTELSTYDDYHLVYALVLGTKHLPTTFARQLPLYLGSESESVWCAAFNCIGQLSGDCLTQEIVRLVRTANVSRSKEDAVEELVARLEVRLSEQHR